MSQFGSVPVDVLVSAVEKSVAKMDETELASAFERELSIMPPDAQRVFIEATFDAFRERGESSEDVAEEAGTTLDRIHSGDPAASSALLRYAAANAGAIKDATVAFIEQRPDLAGALPASLRDAIARRLTAAP